MKSRQVGKSLVFSSALATIVLVSAGCSSSSGNGSGTGGTSATSTASRGAGVPAGEYASGKKIILDTLYRAPLAQNQAAGVKLAASQAGASVNWVGPADINPPEAVKGLQNAVAAGADGAIVAAFPGELFKVPIDRAGMPVVTIDLQSPGSKAGTHFGPSKYDLGVALAEEFAKALPANASGTVVGGICVPGLPVLVAAQQGFTDTIKAMRPGVSVKGDVPVDGDPTKNFGSWQRIIQQNPSALGFIGQCDQDVPNLIKLKKDSNGANWLIGATSGDSPENIAEVKSGTMVAIISQNGWPEGYLSATMLLLHLGQKATLPEGWIDTGYTVITKANADQVTARLENTDLNAAAFKDLVDKVLANPQASIKPFDQCRGCGTSFK